MNNPRSFFSREPQTKNLRIHPNLRNPSRLWTPPRPFKHTPQFFSQAQVRYVHNHKDVHPQLLMLLNDSKIIICRQLPNMGKEYVSRLVFDWNAETIFIQYDGIVKAAITSRIFPVERFIEIAFCAVDSSLQSRGIGRLAMNYLKTVIQASELYDILTCADNEAVTYFKKQGFNDQAIMMDPKRWVGRIKDYEGVTLVHCKIHPNVDYMEFQDALMEQIKNLAKTTGNRIVKPLYTPKDLHLTFPQSPTYLNKSLREIMKKTDNPQRSQSDEQLIDKYEEKMETLNSQLYRILNELKNDEKFGNTFRRPVTTAIAPCYFDTIPHPMDLHTMERRLNRWPDYYKRHEIFASDVALMCDNCKTFNSAETLYYKYAGQALNRFKQLSAQEFPPTPQ